MLHTRIVALAACAAMMGVVPALQSAAHAQDKQSDGERKASSSVASSGEQCIAPTVTKEVDECPANAPKMSQGGGLLGKAQAPHSNLATSQRKKEAAKERQLGPSVEIDAATLRNKGDLQVRAEKLLDKEITVLKRLAKNTPTESPKRPDILLRVAETYFELQQTANAKVRSFDEPIFQARQKKDKDKVKQLTDQQKQAQVKLEEYRKRPSRPTRSSSRTTRTSSAWTRCCSRSASRSTR